MSRVTVEALLFLIFCLLSNNATCKNLQSRVVDLPQGPVRGYKDVEHDIYVFNNIPYATAPTGTDRFKSPLAPPVWTDVFDAVDKGIICPQSNLMGFLTESLKIQEDCLIANIFVPETKQSNLPVVVYVHGGAYLIGWGNLLTPKNLVKSQKIISVTFNYRLGAHGFLCLGTKDVPGNAGMKDQIALLRWVNKNIAKFGGNPDNITLAGYSAGSSSVDLIMISKLSDNLFNKVILESGAGTAVFSIQLDPIKNAKDYAKLISPDKFMDLNALERFYKTVSLDQLNSANVLDMPNSNFLMAPCVERNLGEEMFLDDSPVNILKGGQYKKVPMLYGFAEMEGLFRVSLFNTWKDLMNTKFSDFLPADLIFQNELEKVKIAKQVKQFYFGENTISEETVLRYIDYFTDVIFVYPILRSAKLHIEAGNDQIYLYEYSYVHEGTPTVPYTNIRGANHCAQTMVILDAPINNNQIEQEKNVADDQKSHRRVMRELWLNFILTGKPVIEDSKLPAWPPADIVRTPYMSLNKTTIEIKDYLLKERAKFWEDIYEKYYYHPAAPLSNLNHAEL